MQASQGGNWVQSPVTSCEIRGGWNGMGPGLEGDELQGWEFDAMELAQDCV